ncbi:zona pellucida sperm-binding protein 3-like [Engraulis encrasicolus]|uniref:zona pellucida sperm-binding protein 3-like n=1 Tax=Engraulis encrasicolus TaxID=184585 RepID=UPI002FD2F6D8
MRDLPLKCTYSCPKTTGFIFTILLTVCVKYSENTQKDVSINAIIGLSVECGEKNWEISVERKFFGRSVPFSPIFLRLGEDLIEFGHQPPSPCAPQVDLLTPNRMLLTAGLQDCGTDSEVEGDWLVYTNKLVLTPLPFKTRSGILIQKGEPKVVPIECRFKRKVLVSGEPQSPTWLPMTSTMLAAGLLSFSIRVMTENWESVSSSTLLLQGAPLYLEAMVSAPLHPPLRLYVDYCAATLTPDPGPGPGSLSQPALPLIINQGCLVDSPMSSSSSSSSSSSFSSSFPQFAARSALNILRFSVPAFYFRQDTKSQIVFLRCTLRAVPVWTPPDPLNKACFLHRPTDRWLSVDGVDVVCSCCASGDCREPAGNTSDATATTTLHHVGDL